MLECMTHALAQRSPSLGEAGKALGNETFKKSGSCFRCERDEQTCAADGREAFQLIKQQSPRKLGGFGIGQRRNQSSFALAGLRRLGQDHQRVSRLLKKTHMLRCASLDSL